MQPGRSSGDPGFPKDLLEEGLATKDGQKLGTEVRQDPSIEPAGSNRERACPRPVRATISPPAQASPRGGCRPVNRSATQSPCPWSYGDLVLRSPDCGPLAQPPRDHRAQRLVRLLRSWPAHQDEAPRHVLRPIQLAWGGRASRRNNPAEGETLPEVPSSGGRRGVGAARAESARFHPVSRPELVVPHELRPWNFAESRGNLAHTGGTDQQQGDRRSSHPFGH